MGNSPKLKLNLQHLIKTPHTKNISIGEWNELVLRVEEFCNNVAAVVEATAASVHDENQ